VITRRGAPGPPGRGIRASSHDPSSTKEADLEEERVSHDEVLFGYRLRLSTLAEEIGVRPACRQMGVPLDLLRLEAGSSILGAGGAAGEERRGPRMPNQIGPHLDQPILAFALGHPGIGPS
jgi:hypothetical protein